ncbi:MAG: helix-turn-helix domain-containing protein [Geminicoccaceae bacterium]
MRKDISRAEVRRAARIAPHRTSRRLMAVADVLDGKKLAEVASSLDISVSAVSKWCRRFNEDGIEGLVCRWEARASKASMIVIS